MKVIQANAIAGDCQLCSMLYDKICVFAAELDDRDFLTYKKTTAAVVARSARDRLDGWVSLDDDTGPSLLLEFHFSETGRWGDRKAYDFRLSCVINMWSVDSSKYLDADAQTTASAHTCENHLSSVPAAQIIESVRQWAANCLDDHMHCRALSHVAVVTGCHVAVVTGRMGSMPTRVLDVNPTANLKLRERADIGESEAYITPSHRWGSILPSRLTSDNYADSLATISEHDLALTFRYAIAFARSLRVRYLWIDAL